MDHSDVETTVEKFAPEAPVESCLSCRDAIQTLVGNLIRPPAEHGDARSGPGLNDTGIVGAVLPVPGTSAQILIFHVVNGHLRLTEREHLNDLEEARLTYPGSRGAIAPLMWSLYEAHLVQLHAALDETS